MPTQEIPREQWTRFFDDFSKQHQGWIVTVEVLSSEIGDQEEASGLPLVGISADLKARDSRIALMVGGRPDAHLTHIINTPKRVWFKRPDEGAHEAIEVESEDGTMTLVHFRRVPPEQAGRQLPRKA